MPGPKRYEPRPEEIPSGLCECGCERQTAIATWHNRKKRHFIGHPLPRINGHGARRGAESHKWKGGRWVHKSGYVYIYAPDHPHTSSKGYVFEHRLVMERVLGRRLEPTEHVHHINEDRADNRPENLQVLTRRDHARLHGAEHMAKARAALGPNGYSEAGKKGAAARWGKK